MKTAQEISGTTLNTPIFALQKKRQKGPEKISEEVIAENFTNGKRNSQPSLGSVERPSQDKPKETHTKTHSNQSDKN